MKSVVTIDCNYVYPEIACAYLICEGDRVAVVENNTANAVPIILAALAKHGYAPEQVEYAIITHVHLDHAGGSGILMQKCPNARLLAHPKAARHIVDPSRLISSAKTVYGEDMFRKLYGEIIPVPEKRVRVMEDGEVVSFGSRKLKFIYTRGHANHHFCIHDSGSNGIFTGDSFGIAYPFMQMHGPFLFPSTTPTEFDPAEARLSIQRIRETNADRVYPTHFGEFTHLSEGVSQLLDGLSVFESILETCRARDESGADLARFAEPLVARYFADRAPWLAQEDWKMLQMDIELNAAGIAYSAEKKRKTKTN